MQDTGSLGLVRLSHGCVCVYQSAEWALVKWLTGTEVVDQALNDHLEGVGLTTLINTQRSGLILRCVAMPPSSQVS